MICTVYCFSLAWIKHEMGTTENAIFKWLISWFAKYVMTCCFTGHVPFMWCCDFVIPWSQQSPIIPVTGWVDTMVYSLHRNSSIHQRTVRIGVKHKSLHAFVYLCTISRKYVLSSHYFYDYIYIRVSGFTCLLHRKQKLCPYLSNVFKQSKFVCSPVTGKVLCKWKFGTAKLYGYFKTVGIQVIPVLHSTW